MTLRRLSALTSSALTQSVRRIFKSTQSKEKRRRQTRRRILEQLENRQLMALDILSVSPADGAIDVPVNTNLVITFNENVLKGQGNIHVVNSATGTLGVAVDVTSPNVVVNGAVVTIDLPQDLPIQTDFTVYVDRGTFIDTSGTPTADATLLTEGFEFLPLGPAVDEAGGDGTDFTHVPPLNYELDNTNMPAGGVTEWRGWSFANKDFWAQVDNQSRSAFTRSTGTIAVADPDEFDDRPNGRPFNGGLISKPVYLDGVAANSVEVTFDSSFRPENSQVGTLKVSFDNWATETTLLTLDPSNTTNLGNVDEVRTVPVNNPSSGTMELRWDVTGTNTWWWAIDNLHVTGDITGVPFVGVSDATAWNFTNKRELTVAINPALIAESGGVATATLTRNIPGAELIVTLTSSDTTEATVPATVTIPSGQLSVTFPVTAVDETEIDGTQVATITAAAATYLSGAANVSVTDDDAFAIVSLTPADNSADFPYSNNLQITFNKNVKAGSGRIYVIPDSTDVLGFEVDVNSGAVTFSGATVTINPPGNLQPLTAYYVYVDDGAILDTTTDQFGNTTMLRQTFDLLPLGAFNTETGGDGTDYTKTPPLGFSIPVNPAGGLVEWRGWSFADKQAWINATGGAARANFNRASGNVAVADPDAWDINNALATYATTLQTPAIDLSKITAGSAVLEFDSSFQGLGGPGLADIEVSYNGGSTWTLLATMSANNSNAQVTINNASSGNNGVLQVWTPLNNPASGSMIFRFKITNSGESGWWAIDNLRIAGRVTGRPWEGFADPTQWNFSSSELPTLRMAIDPTSISEAGGTATVTLTRSVFSAGNLTVNLTSSDTGEATVPASVVIPDGQFSTTFVITGINDNILDGDQLVTITATAAGLLNVPSVVVVKSADQPTVTTFNPTDDSTGVPISSDYVVTFNENVKKGNGYIHFVRASDNKLGVSVDVKSSDVTISGGVVTINPPANLAALTDYYVVIDYGAILADNTAVRFGTTLLSEDFEKLPLGPAVFEAPLNANGVDWTATPPAGFTVDNSQMPPGGAPEWAGWTFANKDFWANAGGQGRSTFTRGSGTILIGDTDEWEDVQRPNNSFNSLFETPVIDLTNVAANTVKLEFDSSFRPEDPTEPNNQAGVVEISYDNGTTWANLLTLDQSNTSDSLSAANVNERRVVSINNAASGTMKLRWGLTGTNDYWWAIDNIKVTGDVAGLPFDGISDSTTWSITTADNSLALAIAGGGATTEDVATPVQGTVTRNGGTTGDLVVTLTSSDPTRATVPATVTIPDGASSANFDITVVDNALAGGLRNVEILATATGMMDGSSMLSIADNEIADVKITEIMYNPTGSEPRSEWVEIYNNGSTDADIGGWSLDDEDVFGVLHWSAVPAGTVLPAGSVAVIYNSWFGINTPAVFRAEWNVPAAAMVIPVQWSDLANGPSAANEILALVDAGSTEQDLVNFASDGTIWPTSVDGPSIELKNVALDNSVGTNWFRTVAGASGAVHPTGPNYDVGSTGSPGYIDTDPPAAPTVTLTNDTGVAADLITADGSVTVTPAEPLGTLEYRLNGGAWSSTVPTVTDQGSNTIDARQTDIAGNVGAIGSLTFTLDSVAPSAPTITLNVDTGIVGDLITSNRTYTVTPSEAGGTLEYRLNGGAWQATPPVAAKGVNTIEARQTDAAGNVSSLGALTFTWDNNAPLAPQINLTQDTGTAGDLITSNGAYTVLPREAGGTVEFRLNGGAWSTTQPTAVEGSNLIEARQTDVAGNVGGIGSLTFTLDTVTPTAPSITLDSDTGTPGDFITSVGTYTVTPAEAGGIVEYRLNGGAWSTTAPTAGQGANAIDVRHTDGAGNVSAISSLSFTLDSVVPGVPTITLNSDTGTPGDSITSVGTYTVTPAEAGGTVEYQFNGGGWVTTAPTAIQGANTIEVRQTDTAGNVSPVASLSFTLDSVAPGVPTITLNTDTGTSGDNITSVGTYTATPAEAGGTFEYQLNGGGWVTTAPTAIEGANTIQVRQTDVAGNVSSIASLTFTLDTVSPVSPTVTLDVDSGTAGDFITNNGAYTVTPSEAGGTLEYSTDGSTWVLTKPTAVQGLNTMSVRQTDTAGNVGAVGVLSFTLDSVAAVVTNTYITGSGWNAAFINAIDGNPSNGFGIELTPGMPTLPWAGVNRIVVKFSEDVSGLSSSTMEVRDSSGPLPFTFSYNAATFLATINLNSAVVFNKIRLAISDMVVDVAGNLLDGDNAGGAGGLYNKRFDVIAGDVTGDGRVNGLDLAPYAASFNQQVGQPNFNPRANFNADDRVNGADLPTFSAAFNRALNTLTEPGAPFGGGGGGSYSDQADSFFGGFGDEDDDEEGEDGLFGGL